MKPKFPGNTFYICLLHHKFSLKVVFEVEYWWYLMHNLYIFWIPGIPGISGNCKKIPDIRDFKTFRTGIGNPKGRLIQLNLNFVMITRRSCDGRGGGREGEEEVKGGKWKEKLAVRASFSVPKTSRNNGFPSKYLRQRRIMYTLIEIYPGYKIMVQKNS